MALKLKWKIDPKPTGRFRSFERRWWPSCEYENGEHAAHLYCESDYSMRVVKDQTHSRIVIRVAKWEPRDNGEVWTFKWMRLRTEAFTLKEAKDRAWFC